MKTEIELKNRLESAKTMKNSLEYRDANTGNVSFDEYLQIVTEVEMLETLIQHLRVPKVFEKIRINTYIKVINWYLENKGD